MALQGRIFPGGTFPGGTRGPNPFMPTDIYGRGNSQPGYTPFDPGSYSMPYDMGGMWQMFGGQSPMGGGSSMFGNSGRANYMQPVGMGYF